jgi:RNA polymerase sigma-70 factor, ECF subfamily
VDVRPAERTHEAGDAVDKRAGLHPFSVALVCLIEPPDERGIDGQSDEAHSGPTATAPERRLLHSDGAGELLRAGRQGRVLRRRANPDEVRMQVDTRTAPWDELFTELSGRLRGFVGRRIGDPDSADDVAQEVLLRLHRSLGDLRSEDRLDAFAYRIARNAIIDHYRARAVAKEIPAVPDDLIARIDADGDTDDDRGGARGRQELARCLEPVVRRLPEPYREALLLTDLGTLSQVEAAGVAGLSVPGMKARVQRARVQVHELLTACCEVALDADRQIAEVQRTGPCSCSPE